MRLALLLLLSCGANTPLCKPQECSPVIPRAEWCGCGHHVCFACFHDSLNGPAHLYLMDCTRPKEERGWRQCQ